MSGTFAETLTPTVALTPKTLVEIELVVLVLVFWSAFEKVQVMTPLVVLYCGVVSNIFD